VRLLRTLNNEKGDPKQTMKRCLHVHNSVDPAEPLSRLESGHQGKNLLDIAGKG
jgi:hypothetical protein